MLFSCPKIERKFHHESNRNAPRRSHDRKRSRTGNTRTVSGVVYAIDYPTDDRDYAITTIETDDGNLWDVEDYVAPRSVKLAVTFDTMNTETILDDEVLQIVTVWNA